jgi:epoxide hydrolase 4
MTQTRFVEANGLRFEVLEAGSGDRLALCLHGFPEHAVSWRHQMPVLAAMGYRVWAVNQRGYGRSSRPAQIADYALPNLLDDVAALIDASGAASVTLIGHDWGAMVAWCFAAGRLRKLDRLVIMNVPHPLCFRAALKHWRQLRKSWYIAFFQIPRLPERMLAADGGAAIRRMFARVAVPPNILAVYIAQITEKGAATAMLNWYRAGRVRSRALPDLARPIEVPTLVIWGEEDVALDLICLEGTDRYVRDLTLRRLHGVSHWVQQDAPEAVNGMLQDFLERDPADRDSPSDEDVR